MAGKCRRNCWTKGAGQPTGRPGAGEAGTRATVYGMRPRGVHVVVSGRPTRLMALHSRRLEGIKVQGESLQLGETRAKPTTLGLGHPRETRCLSQNAAPQVQRSACVARA